MNDVKSQILKEVETELGSGAVMVVSDAMDKCPTLAALIKLHSEYYGLKSAVDLVVNEKINRRT